MGCHHAFFRTSGGVGFTRIAVHHSRSHPDDPRDVQGWHRRSATYTGENLVRQPFVEMATAAARCQHVTHILCTEQVRHVSLVLGSQIRFAFGTHTPDSTLVKRHRLTPSPTRASSTA